jgi:hypothetical protein
MRSTAFFLPYVFVRPWASIIVGHPSLCGSRAVSVLNLRMSAGLRNGPTTDLPRAELLLSDDSVRPAAYMQEPERGGNEAAGPRVA